MPGIGIGLVAVALVVAGVLSFSTVIYAGLFSGMILMHVGGHGAHGGHAAHSGGNGEHGEATARDTEDLRQPSSGAQASASGSDHRLDDGVSIDANRIETHDHDQHGAHGCH